MRHRLELTDLQMPGADLTHMPCGWRAGEPARGCRVSQQVIRVALNYGGDGRRDFQMDAARRRFHGLPRDAAATAASRRNRHPRLFGENHSA